MAGIADKLSKAYDDKPIEGLADTPVAALQGVSDGAAEHLKAALNIVAIRDLGTRKSFLAPRRLPNLGLTSRTYNRGS